jgi:hypothetical protein
MTVRRTAGGAFDPDERQLVFLASNVERMLYGATVTDHILVAVNELTGPDSLRALESWLDAGKKVLIDSGIFTTVMTHARTYGLTMPQALSLAPDRVAGFEALFERYVEVIKCYGDRAWGYIELDQGGREHKAQTRAILEGDYGLSPIPVYHPKNDGWAYFDELAAQYDRICFANLVDATPAERRRLFMTAWARKCRYPHLWIHHLGVSPTDLLYAMPVDSCDCSSWLGGVRWNNLAEKAMGRVVCQLGDAWGYVQGSDPAGEAGSRKAVRVAAWCEVTNQRNWQIHMQRFGRLGVALYPPALAKQALCAKE